MTRLFDVTDNIAVVHRIDRRVIAGHDFSGQAIVIAGSSYAAIAPNGRVRSAPGAGGRARSSRCADSRGLEPLQLTTGATKADFA